MTTLRVKVEHLEVKPGGAEADCIVTVDDLTVLTIRRARLLRAGEHWYLALPRTLVRAGVEDALVLSERTQAAVLGAMRRALGGSNGDVTHWRPVIPDELPEPVAAEGTG